MGTREKILEAVQMNQPPAIELTEMPIARNGGQDLVAKYMEVFESIGGLAFLAEDMHSVTAMIKEKFDSGKRIVTNIPELGDPFELLQTEIDPHVYEDVELAIIKGHFAVAENGAVWITEELMGHRIIPYICQHLAVVVNANSLVPTLHEAYEKIGTGDYGFGAFISGPSKTADIEQALVLGAHGPLSMTVFILK